MSLDLAKPDGAHVVRSSTGLVLVDGDGANANNEVLVALNYTGNPANGPPSWAASAYADANGKFELCSDPGAKNGQNHINVWSERPGGGTSSASPGYDWFQKDFVSDTVGTVTCP